MLGLKGAYVCVCVCVCVFVFVLCFGFEVVEKGFDVLFVCNGIMCWVLVLSFGGVAG